jgi:uncharacterized Zn finger protein
MTARETGSTDSFLFAILDPNGLKAIHLPGTNERSRIMSWNGEWAPYVSVGQRQARAVKYAAQLAKKQKRSPAPVKIAGRKIATTFWGLAWCQNLERYSDYANRLPRGQTYVRNGSVVDLQIKRGKIEAIVAGSAVYEVGIDIKTLPRSAWKLIQKDCAQSISSLIDLLQGRFSEGVMGRLTEPKTGLFPHPHEISMNCSCPDSAYLCKHLAAVMYAIGARLDTDPELLFTLRDVDHLDLIGAAVASESLDNALSAASDESLAGADLGAVFGIELDVRPPQKPKNQAKAPRATKPVAAKTDRNRSRVVTKSKQRQNVKARNSTKRPNPGAAVGSNKSSVTGARGKTKLRRRKR